MGAAKTVRRVAAEAGVHGVRCAAVLGDAVTERARQHPELRLLDADAPLESILSRQSRRGSP